MNKEELLERGLWFHGHKCPAMPMGLRAGLAAMKALNVARAQDKELFVVAETGKGHAAGCFLDGIMTATGCTFVRHESQNATRERSLDQRQLAELSGVSLPTIQRMEASESVSTRAALRAEAATRRV